MRASEFITEGGGYIPQTEEEAHDPRFMMAITCDIHPGEDVKHAAKFNFKLGKGGRPPFLRSNGKITESPDFNYSRYNNREEELSKLSWKVRSGDFSLEIMTYFDQTDRFDPNKSPGWLDASTFSSTGDTNPDNVDKWDSLQIRRIHIDDAWRGTGLGQLLYERAITEARKRNRKYLTSDFRHRVSPDAEKAWDRLSQRYPVKYRGGQYWLDLRPKNNMKESTNKFTKKTDFRFKKGALLMQRIGPINAQKQNIIIRKPPVNRGMWAFPYPAFDMFFAHHKIEPLLPADLRSDAIRATYDKAQAEGRDKDEDFREAYQHLWDLREKASEKLKDKMRPKTFWWDGPIYSHISPHEGENDLGSGWYLWTDLKAWAKAANKSMVAFDSYKAFGVKANPAEQGFPTYSSDHLEVFLPEKAEITKQKKGR